jgi:hypothetical protein
MKRLLPLAAATLLLALFPITCHLAPRLWDRVAPETHAGEPLRRAAWDTAHRLSRRNGCRPLEEWPEHDRAVYRAALRVLADAGD